MNTPLSTEGINTEAVNTDAVNTESVNTESVNTDAVNTEAVNTEALESGPPVDVVIVGAGFTGLSAALELAGQGLRCRVIEAAPEIGGLAGTFEADGHRLDRFYHHWFSSDHEMLELCARLGISHLLEAHETRTGVYYANSVYRLSAPLDVLRFAPLALSDRIRLGVMTLRAQRVKHWRELESRTAEEWLISLGGRRVYEVVWRPLLEGKFGKYADQVGATWMWTKLHLRGGSRTKAARRRSTTSRAAARPCCPRSAAIWRRWAWSSAPGRPSRRCGWRTAAYRASWRATACKACWRAARSTRPARCC